jgi:hypothetical protein
LTPRDTSRNGAGIGAAPGIARTPLARFASRRGDAILLQCSFAAAIVRPTDLDKLIDIFAATTAGEAS